MTSQRNFNPHKLDLDVYVQDVQGLGRGKGFKVIGRRSELHTQSVIVPIKGRLLNLLSMLYKERLLSMQEVARRFGLILPQDYRRLEDERDALRAGLEETEGQLKEVGDELDEVKGEQKEADEGFSEKLQGLTDLIADALEEDSEDWEFEGEEEDEDYVKLKFGLERLIDSFQALRAQGEES